MNTQQQQAERARLALMVIGPARRERLITRYADRLCLRYGMRPAPARRYAAGLVDEADPVAVLAVGQTWTLPDGATLPGGELFRFAAARSYTIVGFTGEGLVSVGDGKLHLNPRLFAGMWLTAWPETYTLEDEPQPPGDPLPDLDDETAAAAEHAGDETVFDPRHLWVIVHRAGKDGIPLGEGLPLLGDHYTAANWRPQGAEPSYMNALDVPAYLDEHLADYRAGWPDFADRSKPGDRGIGYFNTLDDGEEYETNVAVAAYLGNWLWQRIRGDVVTEYGGTVADYDVMFMWAPFMADMVLEAAPYADPEWELPADHRLAQCEGQLVLPLGLARLEPGAGR